MSQRHSIFFFFIFLANVAAFAAGILFYLTYLPIDFLNGKQYELMTRAQKMATGLLPNCAMSFGVMSIMIYEGTGIIFGIIAFDPSINTMDHPDFIVCSFLSVKG